MTPDDVSREIPELIQAGTAAADALSRQVGLHLEYLNVEDALVDVLDLKSPVDLLGRHLSCERIMALLAQYDFQRLFPEVLAEIRLESAVIPATARRHLSEVTVRSNGELWRIHKNDADPWPSNPHAHNLETGLKLHLGTGELFLKRRSVGEKISKKDLKAIRSELRSFALPPLAE
jgi:hypothetical protein